MLGEGLMMKRGKLSVKNVAQMYFDRYSASYTFSCLTTDKKIQTFTFDDRKL